MIHNHGREILREIHTPKGMVVKLWARPASLAILALVLLVALVAITGTGDYQQCVNFSIC